MKAGKRKEKLPFGANRKLEHFHWAEIKFIKSKEKFGITG